MDQPRELRGMVERRVLQRTHRSIQDLTVDMVDESIVISGRTNTFYVKQLATQAAQEVIADGSLSNEITVG